MKELDLFKFITDNQVEYHWHDTKIYAFISVYDIEEFNKLLGSGILDEEGIECAMKEGYFVFEMSPICDYFDIDPLRVFPNKD